MNIYIQKMYYLEHTDTNLYLKKKKEKQQQKTAI